VEDGGVGGRDGAGGVLEVGGAVRV
jgi:hypothetical protein